MTSWLQRQRKQTLLDLSSEAGLKQDDDLKKDDIVDALDAHLQQNQTRLARNATFEPYYGVRRTPYKTVGRPSGVSGVTSDEGEVKSVVRGRGRRATKVKQELEDTDGVASSPLGHDSNHTVPNTSALAKRTPARPTARRQSHLPASPADVADLAEYETSQIYAGLNDLYTISGIPDTIEHVRDLCSSVTGVQMAFLCLESLALQREVLPWDYITSTGPIGWLGGLNINFYFPNLWHVLEPGFWFPTLLWATTSLAVPSFVAYFFNLTIRDVKRHGARVSVARYPVDPLTFNVVKALSTYIIYGQGWAADVIGPMTVEQVSNAMYGGYRGVLIGCCVCILASLYEAAQRK